jgi:hypothetical protein
MIDDQQVQETIRRLKERSAMERASDCTDRTDG